MKKVLIYILLALLALIVIPIAFLGLRIAFDLENPMRQSNEQIRADLLELTPIGMSIEDIVQVIASNEKWKVDYVNYDHGVYMGELGYPDDPEDYALKKMTVRGEKSIRATIGGYTNFYMTFVDVWWAFDEDSKLIEIFVKKAKIGL